MKTRAADPVARRGRGRPREDTGTRKAIVRAARAQFSERGYGHTTLRSIARAAGVDPRLLLHYFGSKQELFSASVELPIDSAEVVATVFADGPGRVADHAAHMMVGVLEDAGRRQPLLALLRAAVSEPEAADAIRDVLSDRLLLPIATRLGGAEPRLRATMVASQVVGLAIVRYVLRMPPLADASPDQLVAALQPTLEHYFHGDWVAP